VRILVGIPEKGSRGGPAACEPPFIDELRRLGNEVEEEVYAYAETQLSYFRRILRVLQTARRFRERVRTRKFDLVHINTSFDSKALLRDFLVISSLPAVGTKIFLKFHGSDGGLLKTNNSVWRYLGRYLLQQAQGIGVLSSEERDNFLNAGVSEKKIFVVKNVVQNKPEGRDPQFRAKMNLPEDVPLLLFIGRFIESKGLMDVISACKLLRECNQPFMLLCVGDGIAREGAEVEVDRLGLGSNVRFFGYVPEEQATAFYANSTILLFPTYHYEGFPMVIFNAAAAGLPIITTRIRAAADYLKEPDNCLWVEPRRPDLLVARIIEVLGNAELRARVSASNKQRATHFSAEIVTEEYLRIYERAVG
jgi:glycosyltransferase involved in cell wall biosynthesis